MKKKREEPTTKSIICSIGHTAAGKTTVLRKIAASFCVPFISEGKIKREMVGENFNVTNSVDENLRSKGYREAIKQAFEILRNQDCVILDASFHQLFRRKWIYEAVKEHGFDDITVYWIYCYCPDIETVEKRILDRYNDKIKTSDNQASSIEVYNYTMKTFDAVNILDFPMECCTVLIKYNSFNEVVEAVETVGHVKNAEFKDRIVKEVTCG